MKKILFLLLLSISMYGQVPADATPLENIQITNNVEDNASTKVTVQNANGVQNWKFATSLPISTAVANALDLKVENSAGAIEGFAITDNGNGTVNIATGTAYLRTTNDPYAPLIKYVIPAVTNLALTDNANNFVLVDYNSGTPALTVSVSPGTVNTMTNSIAYVISRVGNTLDYVSLIGQNIDANGKLRRRFLNSEGLKRASGAVLSGLNRSLVLTTGLYYSGLIEVPTPAFNTSTGATFTQAYVNGGSWTRTTGNTQINNTQYSLAGVLTAMPSNDYRVDYVYILADNPSKLYVLLGNTTYNNIGSARLAPVPSDLPSELQFLGTRVGRIIIQKDALTMEVSSEFATIYQAGSAQLHNDLAGLNAGDFQHLTVAEKADLVTKTGTQSITGLKTFDNILLKENAYGSSIYNIGQTMGLDDNWKIYGLAPSIDKGELVFEVGDNGSSYDTVGERFRFHYNATNSGISKSPLIIDYNDITANANLTATSFVKAGGTNLQFLMADGSVSLGGGGGGSGDMVLADAQTVTGEKTFLDTKFSLRNVANTFSSYFTNANTASRTYTLQNKTGTIAQTDDYAFRPLDEGNGIGRVVNGRIAANYGNIGLASVDLSTSTSASGTKGATGQYSFVAGANNTASQQFSTVGGGADNIASGPFSTVGGGYNNISSGINSAVIGGDSNQATATYSFVSGGSGNIASGINSSISGGEANRARSYNEWVGGSWGTDYTPLSTTAWNALDRQFNIGNGTSTTRSNALTILKNGLATLPSVTNALIQAETTGKAVITKEYVNRTFTVATLPTPASGVAYATVTDATSPTYLGALTGGGSVVCPVFFNGSTWVSH